MVLKRTFVHIGVMGRRMQPLNVRFNLTESSQRAGPESVRGLFANVSNQTGLDTMSKAQRPIKVEIKGGVPGRSRNSNPAGLCCSLNH